MLTLSCFSHPTLGLDLNLSICSNLSGQIGVGGGGSIRRQWGESACARWSKTKVKMASDDIKPSFQGRSLVLS